MNKDRRRSVVVGLKSRCFLFLHFLQNSLIRGRKSQFHVQGIRNAVWILFHHSKSRLWRSKQWVKRSSTVFSFRKRIHQPTMVDCLFPISLCCGSSVMNDSLAGDVLLKSTTDDTGIQKKSNTGFFKVIPVFLHHILSIGRKITSFGWKTTSFLFQLYDDLHHGVWVVCSNE